MSTLKQEDSIERQRSQVLPLVERQGYAIAGEYVDEGISGGETLKRKQFQRLLRDAHNGKFDVIVCDDKDRFGRFDTIDLGEIVAPLRRKGVTLETVAQGKIDWDSFSGRITDAILQEARNLEQEAMSRRVLSNQLLRAGKGFSTGGQATYGYRWEVQVDGSDSGKRLVPDGRKAEVVQLIFKLYDRGLTLFALAEELYRRGVASPKGGARWTRSVIQRLLSNRKYVGDWTWGIHVSGRRHRFGKGNLRPTRRGERAQIITPPDEWLVRPDTHEPLIDRELFERVQARLKGNRERTTPHRNGGNFVLSRLLVCGHCGAYLVGVQYNGYREYVCGGYLAYGKGHCKRNRVLEKPILNLLIRQLQKTFLDPDNLQRLRAELAAQEAEERSDANRKRLRRLYDQLESKIQRGNENLAILPADRLPGVVATLREWEKERNAVQADLKRIDAESPTQNLEQQVAAAEALLWRLQEAFAAEDAPLLRQTFVEMLSRVELYWTHHAAGSVTRPRFQRGVICLRPTEASYKLSPGAGR
jgi:DNA invertase Pin-like site-specific DNA recombinase